MNSIKPKKVKQPKFTFYFKSQGKNKYNEAVLMIGDKFRFS